jgi:3-deoxy-D-manno-octulosonate 8-phosphate phosphatase (KDO 8-P phosphatase)
MKFKVFLLDVDGVMTTGQFFYTSEGKIMKVFGPDDRDALLLLKKHLAIRFVSADKNGFEISKRRIVNDLKYQLDLVSGNNRINWIKDQYDPKDVIYMGDGIFDHYIFDEVGYSIAPANSIASAKQHASFVTERSGGDRAVAEACLHIINKFSLS